MKRFPLISLPNHLLQEIKEVAKRTDKGPQTVVKELLEFGLHAKVLFPQESIEFAKRLRTLIVESEPKPELANGNQPIALLFQGHLRTPAEILYPAKDSNIEVDNI